MPLDKPLNLSFELEELNSSVARSTNSDAACEDFSRQAAIYRGQYMEALLTNSRLEERIKHLEATIDKLKQKLEAEKVQPRNEL